MLQNGTKAVLHQNCKQYQWIEKKNYSTYFVDWTGQSSDKIHLPNSVFPTISRSPLNYAQLEVTFLAWQHWPIPNINAPTPKLCAEWIISKYQNLFLIYVQSCGAMSVETLIARRCGARRKTSATNDCKELSFCLERITNRILYYSSPSGLQYSPVRRTLKDWKCTKLSNESDIEENIFRTWTWLKILYQKPNNMLHIKLFSMHLLEKPNLNKFK